MNEQIDQICSDILDGKYDAFRFHLMDALQARSQALMPKVAKLAARDFRIGNLVKFNDKVSPKYLIGRTAKVTKVNRERVKIVLAEDCGRFRAGKQIACPVSILTLV